MILRRVVPDAGGELDVDAPDARHRLLDWYAPHAPDHVRLNLVTTLDGRAAGGDGTSESLTSRTDRMILGVIRQHADIVLVGAESVRREGYVRPRRAALAILSASGDLTGHRLAEPRRPSWSEDPGPEPAMLVLTTARGADRALASAPMVRTLILPAPDGRIDPAAAIAALRADGYRGIAAEGGPSLAGQLHAAGLVDELCLTIMPSLGGPSLPLLGSETLPVTPAAPRQLLLDEEGALYGRWNLRSAHPPPHSPSP